MSAIFVAPNPITATNFSVPKSRNLHKPTKIFAKRLNLFGEISCRKSVSWRRNQSTMKGSDGVSASASASASDEGIEAFEQDGLVEGALTFGGGGGGLEATLNNLSKWLVSALFSAIILWRHDAGALWAAMGAVLNAILSMRLKKVLNQERPIATLRSDPGMPSSHAQSIFYTITFLNVSMVEWCGMNAFTATLSGLFLIFGSYFSWLRVSQQLHTVSQVIVGAVLGSIFSVFWFWSWYSFVLSCFVSFLWVRIMVVVGALAFVVGFILHVYRSWIVKER